MTTQKVNRLNDIVHVVIGGVHEGGISRRQICDRVGLKKTPYSIGLIDDVEVAGWIFKITNTAVWPHCYVYHPTDKALEVYSHAE